MKPRFLLSILVPALALAPIGRTAETKSSAEVAVTTNEAKPRIFSLDFSGGSLGKLLADLAKVDGISFSVITAGGPADLNVELPPFALRNASLITLYEVLQPLLAVRGYDMNVAGGADGRNSLVGVLRRMEKPAPRARSSDFASHQLAPYLAEQSVDDIVGALRAAWELDPAHDRAALHLKYHPPTSILLVSGPPEAIEMTRRVLQEMKRSPDKAAKSALLNAPPPAETEKK
jgi:hypothetical protein